jgi:glycosyltransferase involved in cell wall biosynthesis
MKQTNSLSKRADFFWAFLLNRRKPDRRPAHSSPHEPTVSVVVPALNEAENLPYVLPRIPDWVNEVLLVDGHSTDNTVAVALQLRPDIHILEQEGCGKGAALRTGLLAATGDIIVMLDADGSMDPAEIPAFVGALISGADFVKGSRFLQGCGTLDMPLLRRLGNWALVKLTNVLFRTHFTDITYGYNAVWREHADALALEIDGWAQEIVSNIRAVRARLRVVEVGSYEYKRITGTAKLVTFSAGWTILKAIIRERFRRLEKPKTVMTLPKAPAAVSLAVQEAEAPGQIPSQLVRGD